MRDNLVRHLVFIAALALSAMYSGEGHAAPSAASIIAGVKLTSGGAAWNDVGGIESWGESASFGLAGKYRSLVDLHSGRFMHGADYGFLANAEGLDESGRWRMDNSRGVHPLDSVEAKLIAVSESYLAAFGYLFPDRFAADLEAIEPITDSGVMYDRIKVVPRGGRAIELWMRRDVPLVTRAVIQRSTVVETIQYGDFRSVGRLKLPFEIDIDNGDEAETGIAKIATYKVLPAAERPDIRRPASRTDDIRIRTGASVGHAPFALEPTSRFPIVFGSVNGSDSLPFILDTGGHMILTVAAAGRLKLATVGKGISRGAGARTTPTRFAKVDKLTLGDVDLINLPFTVLETDLSMARGPNGDSMPVAGIVGIELFERFLVTMDYKSRSLTLAPAGTSSISPTRAVTLPLRFTSDMPLTEASIDGHAGWFALDTGNNVDVIVFHEWARRNGFESAYRADNLFGGSSIGGSLELHKGRARTFAIGPHAVEDVDLLFAGDNMGSLSSRSEAGNIGESILSRFKLTFDYSHQSLVLADP